jgi:cell division protein FtsB
MSQPSQKRRTVEQSSAVISGVVAGVAGSRRRLATVAAAMLALGLAYHVVFGPNGVIVYEQKRMDAATLDRELRMLERENEQLKGHVDRLQSDPDAIEHQAREELHYARPGEVIYTLPPEPAKR